MTNNIYSNFHSWLFMLLLWSCTPIGVSAQDIKSKSLDELGGVYYNYGPLITGEEAINTPAPSGYEPVYISHYGRHGSRWLTEESRYEWLMQWFEDEERLTPMGKDVKKRLKRVYADAKGNAGLLTLEGKRQHEFIAKRMAKRFPQIFAKKGASIVALASTSKRCVQSRDAFLGMLQSLNSSLNIQAYSREADMDFLAYSSPEEEYLIKHTKVSPTVANERFINSLFKSVDTQMDKEKFMTEMHTLATDMQDVGIGIDFYDLFTREEMEALYWANCTRMWICNGINERNGGVPQLSAESLWNDIVSKADEALSEHRHEAHLRFGHDTCIYRLLSLWGLYADNQRLDELIPMAANIQLVFYRKEGEKKVLVKLLHNEKEIQMPMESECGCYYDWQKMKQMVAIRLNDLRQSHNLSMLNTMVGTAPSIIKSSNIFGKDTELSGQTIPAVLVPNGMNFWTPQTRATEKKCVAPYYYNDTKWQGFRNSHWIVGGCTQDYGSATLMPEWGSLRKEAEARATPFSHADEISTPYYYCVVLPVQHIKAEMTGTSRAAIFRFTYHQAGDAYLLVEVNSDEQEGHVGVDAQKGEIEGYNPVHRIYQGWGESAGFAGHFFVKLHGKECIDSGTEGNYAWVRFHVEEGEQVLVKMSSSFCNIDGAKKNMYEELPGWDFDARKDSLKTIWQHHLNTIEAESDDISLLRKFYTALYHCSFLPHAFNDVDGQYPVFAQKTNHIQKTRHDIRLSIPQTTLKRVGHEATTFYMDFSLWDTYRALHPLVTLLSPHKSGEMMQSLVSMYEDGGWMPIFPCWNSYTAAMIGDHSCAAIADAYCKGVRNFNIQKAYEGIKKNAFKSPRKKEYANGMGRRALKSYRKYGYIPLEDTVEEAFHTREQVSRTLEYSYDDFCAAQIARQLGHEKDFRRLMQRSENWRNVLNPHSGYVQGKYKNGVFSKDDNAFSFQKYITEGVPCHYTWYVPHNLDGLIQSMGGSTVFESKLDSMFSEKRYWHGNEPCHQIAYLFNYTQHPFKTQREVRNILNNEYMDHPGGLSGNDDAGQMSAWYVFSAMGFYPVCPGTTHYQIGSPSFRQLTIHLENGKTFTLQSPHASAENIYIQSMELNGKPYNKTYIDHNDIMQGGTLKFQVRSVE